MVALIIGSLVLAKAAAMLALVRHVRAANKRDRDASAPAWLNDGEADRRAYLEGLE